jgi:hypothetical protein
MILCLKKHLIELELSLFYDLDRFFLESDLFVTHRYQHKISMVENEYSNSNHFIHIGHDSDCLVFGDINAIGVKQVKQNVGYMSNKQKCVWNIPIIIMMLPNILQCMPSKAEQKR